MPISQALAQYYQTEIRHCFSVAVSGIVLIAAAFAFLYFFKSQAIVRAACIAVGIGSLIFLFGGFFAGKAAQKEMPEKIQLYETDKENFIKIETQKVEKIHNNWLGVKIFWSAVVLAGLVLLFASDCFSSKNILTGISIGLLILGAIGIVEEIKSMQHNEKYYNEIISASQISVSQ